MFLIFKFEKRFQIFLKLFIKLQLTKLPPPATPKKLTANSVAAQVSVEGKKVNLDNIAEKLQRISRIDWENFDEKLRKK